MDISPILHPTGPSRGFLGCRRGTGIGFSHTRLTALLGLTALLPDLAALVFLAAAPVAHAQTLVTNTNTVGGWTTNSGTTNWATNNVGFNATNFSTAALGANVEAVFTNTTGNIALKSNTVYLNYLYDAATTGSFLIGTNVGDGTLSFTGSGATIATAAGSETLTINSSVALDQSHDH